MESEAAAYVLARVKDKFGFLFNKDYVLEAGNDEIIIIKKGKDVMAWIPSIGDMLDLIKEQAALFNRKPNNMQIYPHEDNLRIVIGLVR